VLIVAGTRTISLLAAVTATAVCLSSAAARADDSGLYVGANVGRSLTTFRHTDLDNALIAAFGGADSGFSLGSSSVQKDHVMWSADFGYMISRNFGIEASYLHLGSLTYSAAGTQSSSDGTGTSAVSLHADIKSGGPALALLGVLPMTNLWEIDARVGAYEGKTTTTYSLVIDDDVTSRRPSKTSTSLLAGLGTALTVSNHCTVRVDYMRLEHVKEQTFDRAFNVDLVTAGVAFVF
jgi:opacity protein-like surface antigen